MSEQEQMKEKIEKMFDRQTEKYRMMRKYLLASLSLIISIIATLLSSYLVLSPKTLEKKPTIDPMITVVDASGSLNKRVDSLQQNLDNLKKQLDSMKGAPVGLKANIPLAEMQSDITTIKSNIKKMEDAIMDNPSKALSLPLLQKDVENLKLSYRSELSAVKEEISRVYDLNKWFIGLMFTMAIGLLGLAISNFLQGKKKE